MLTRMAPLLTRMARMLTRMARMLTRMTRWLAGSHIIHTRKRLIGYDYLIFRRGTSFKIFSCNITPPATRILNENLDNNIV